MALIMAPASLSLVGFIGWGTVTCGLTGFGTPNANAAVNAGRSAEKLLNLRVRPYRARGFDRSWNRNLRQPVPMPFDTRRAPIRQFAPGDIEDYDAIEPITGG